MSPADSVRVRVVARRTRQYRWRDQSGDYHKIPAENFWVEQIGMKSQATDEPVIVFWRGAHGDKTPDQGEYTVALPAGARFVTLEYKMTTAGSGTYRLANVLRSVFEAELPDGAPAGASYVCGHAAAIVVDGLETDGKLRCERDGTTRAP